MEKENEKTMLVSECFTSIQGEGKFTGIPSVFLRLNGCNLRCCFKDSICDTPYTSHHAEQAQKLTIQEVSDMLGDKLDEIGGSPENSHMVITGGEPMLQQSAIVDLLDQDDWWNEVTIETNGTIVPCEELLTATNVMFSVSPKLTTSCCFEGKDIPAELQALHCKNRINIEALARIILNTDYQLKFVYSGSECEDEIHSIIEKVEEYIESHNLVSNNLAKIEDISNHIMLMPEGITNEQLAKSAQEAVQVCIKNGWRYCDRVHIRVWGDKRGV